jgi:hypothetical protein
MDAAIACFGRLDFFGWVAEFVAKMLFSHDILLGLLL